MNATAKWVFFGVLIALWAFELVFSLLGQHGKAGRLGKFVYGDTKGVTHYEDSTQAYAERPRKWILTLVMVVLLVFSLIYMGEDVNFNSAFYRPINWPYISKRCGEFFRPDWTYFFGPQFDLKNDFAGVFISWDSCVLYNLLVALGITFLGTLLGAIIAIPLGIWASHKLFGKKAYISETILILIRTFPELLLALNLLVLSGLNAITGILAIGLHSIGMLGKLYADQIDESDLSAMEAGSACGANKYQTIALTVMPDVFPQFLSVALYRFDINIRTGTMLGLILGQNAGIGFLLQKDMSAASFRYLGTDIFGIVLLVIAVDLISAGLRKKLV